MTIQVILTIVLCTYIFYALFQRKNAHIVSELTSLAALTGVVLVWNPNLATMIANEVGVGRGADLIFYCFIVAGLIVSLHLHLCIKRSNQVITDLARAMAINNVRHPSPNPPSC